ncbi:ABC transporter substrate-binding protein [Streptomyces sp. TS71-3]|uniref:ABC transporter substrate-binding protein n=1 Tax=Streptomyces sp. TS71-3 TaxID=2733862 RepID=UPI001B16C734|nr:extracellular solute-binding protein [Streptomyces sp. TS71-3]GHJ36477.1 sugar ABC transporter substrate-binding protein [Streptomyces sp. TS71-3]
MLTARRRAAAAVATAVAGSLLLASCGGSGGGSSDPNTLKLWHYEAPNSAMGIAWNEAIKEFEKGHPGVMVKFEEKGFEQIQKTAPMVLNSDDAPDLMEYNKGNATAGLLSRQGLLTDLTDEAHKRGWDKQVTGGVRTTSQYSPGGVMGSGKWYGIPNYAEFSMVYYNKDLFAKYHVKVPKTIDEMTAAMDTFVKHGVTPLSDGGAEYVAQQYLYQLALSKADRSWVDAYQLYKGKTDFHDAAWTYAADTFADWVKKGYIAKDSSSVKAEDAGTAFISGKYPMLSSGSWWFGRFQDEVKFDWGTYLWPGSSFVPGSGGNLWVVPQGAKNKDLAYEFIDITLKKTVQNLLGNKGGVPIAADPGAITDPQSKQLIKDFDAVSGRDGLAYYPDWPVPGFYDVLVSEVQKLITGTGKPADTLTALQKAYDDGVPKS